MNHFESEFQAANAGLANTGDPLGRGKRGNTRCHIAGTFIVGALFLCVTAVIMAADEGQWGLWADNTPAHYIFVGLIQAALFVWILAFVIWLWERRKIPVHALLTPKTKRNSGASELTAMLGGGGLAAEMKMKPTTSKDVRVMAMVLTSIVTLSVGAYTSLCWDEAKGNATDCKTGSPVPVEFACIVAAVLPFVLPWPLPGWRQRKRFLWRLLQCFGCVVGFPALSCDVSFIHVLITDALTSSCLLLWDLEYAICLFTTSSWKHGMGQGTGQGDQCGAGSWNATNLKPMILALPFWLRFVQCIWQVFTDKSARVVQAFNALKYVTALAVVFTSAAQTWFAAQKDAWFIAWIVALVVKTVYSYYWDVVMDWGLVKFGVSDRSSSGGAMGLADSSSKCCLGMCNKPQIREWRLYPNGIYIAALIFNFVGRISWALAISPDFCKHSCRLLVGLMEVVRRGVWLVLRVEYACTESTAGLFGVLDDGDWDSGAATVQQLPLLPSVILQTTDDGDGEDGGRKNYSISNKALNVYE